MYTNDRALPYMPVNLVLNPQANIGQTTLRWSFNEFKPLERSKRWWVISGIVALVLVTYAVMTGNFLFALIILMVSVLIVNQSRTKPKRLDCQITTTGVAVGKKYWRWSEIENFWIAYHPPEVTNLYLLPKGLLEPRLTVPLERTNPLKVRELLVKYLSEDLSREDEPTSEALSRLFKLQ